MEKRHAGFGEAREGGCPHSAGRAAALVDKPTPDSGDVSLRGQGGSGPRGSGAGDRENLTSKTGVT